MNVVRAINGGVGYFICIGGNQTKDKDMALWLGIELEEYKNILFDQGAYEKSKEHWFETKKECKDCIEFLQPWIIMKVITE